MAVTWRRGARVNARSRVSAWRVLAHRGAPAARARVNVRASTRVRVRGAQARARPESGPLWGAGFRSRRVRFMVVSGELSVGRDRKRDRKLSVATDTATDKQDKQALNGHDVTANFAVGDRKTARKKAPGRHHRVCRPGA